MRLDELNLMSAKNLSNFGGAADQPFVFGEGKIDQPLLMLIGEAPGAQEVLSGRPFVGKAGKNLDYFLQLIHQDRSEIYITNTVKFRPTKTGLNGTQSNRPPNQTEVDIFKPWLMDEIQLVSPYLIVTLGNVPLQALLGQDARIGFQHGKLTKTKDSRLIFPLYHPAAIIYNQGLAETYEQDLNNLQRLLSTRDQI